jgi:hypothetical protein
MLARAAADTDRQSGPASDTLWPCPRASLHSTALSRLPRASPGRSSSRTRGTEPETGSARPSLRSVRPPACRMPGRVSGFRYWPRRRRCAHGEPARACRGRRELGAQSARHRGFPGAVSTLARRVLSTVPLAACARPCVIEMRFSRAAVDRGRFAAPFRRVSL